jgi:hypothetical protein
MAIDEKKRKEKIKWKIVCVVNHQLTESVYRFSGDRILNHTYRWSNEDYSTLVT